MHKEASWRCVVRIAFGFDEKTHLIETIRKNLEERGREVIEFAPGEGEDTAWPRVAREAAETVAAGSADEGIVLCWTGTGVSIAANKVPGIRAALCGDAETARGARLWNNANILCMSIRRTSEVLAGEILEAWFGTSYQPNDVDDACLTQIDDLDTHYRTEPDGSGSGI